MGEAASAEKRRPISLKFGGKHDYVPLQAADILAYEANHVIRDPAAKRRKSWTALSPNGRGMTCANGEPTMHELVQAQQFRQRLKLWLEARSNKRFNCVPILTVSPNGPQNRRKRRSLLARIRRSLVNATAS